MSSGVTVAGAQRLARLRRFAWWMDEGIRIPGTRMRIGLDPILGLVPGIGDAAGAVLAGAIVIEAVQQGISRFGLLRMAGNIALDTVIGAVPVIGDLFDAGWKGNRRNLQILDRYVGEPGVSKRADRGFVALLGGALIVGTVAVVITGLWLASQVIGWLLTQL